MRKHGITALTMMTLAVVASAAVANGAFEGGAWVPFTALAACSVVAVSVNFGITVSCKDNAERLAYYAIAFFVILILGAFVAGSTVEANTYNSGIYGTREHVWRYAKVLPWAAYAAALVACVLSGIIHLIVEDPEAMSQEA